MHLKDLKKTVPADLVTMAEELGVEGASTLRKQDLMFAILKAEAENGEQIMGEGTIEVLPDGFGFLRSPEANFLAGPDDIYVSPNQVRKFGLRTGDTVEGEIRAPKDGERYFALTKLTTVNFDDPDVVRHRVNFDNLTPLYPDEKLRLDTLDPTVKDKSARVIDIVSPQGKGQRTLIASLHSGLQDSVSTTEARFEALEQAALARNQRLTQALEQLTAETRRIDEALSAGGATAEKLIGSAETLLVALDSSVRELDETYPAALTRFDARLEQSRALLGSAAPEMERLEAISEALVGRAEEAEALLRGQGSRLTEWLESTQGGLEANRDLVNRLRSALDAAHQDANRITEGAGPLLVTALLRVKDTAEQAAERARQALGRAIPEAAQQLAEASEQAVESVVSDKVAAQIAQIAHVADEAVKAAHQASERLTRQLLTIADTSASIDQRIEEARQATEDRDRDHFARRSALLIESLNSTAIDVAKILSNDVTDSAWSAYLKGDRGVFTRRAVKLLDAGESREIALHYDNDAEFRDHVNRYIHDFEAMLRVILSSRDGNALGVAILSSDMGKLYVALAQAIERLRQ